MRKLTASRRFIATTSGKSVILSSVSLKLLILICPGQLSKGPRLL